MKVNYNYIKSISLLLVVGGLFAFSNQRNSARKVGKPHIKFLGENTLFITEETVSKLLILNQQSLADQPKDIIDLNDIESALNANAMVKDAEVFMSVNGGLSVEIEQKRPIARVRKDASYYIDDEGSFMPLSSNYSARVPLVTGNVTKNKLKTVYEFAKVVDEDEFLKKHVIKIHENPDGTLDFQVRKNEFTVHLGTLRRINKKINNFKAFYQKALKDNVLDSYALVNLKFDKQVICTKK